jgi:hypothetical protein
MQLGLYLTEKEYAALKRYAESRGESVNFVIRLALREVLGLPVSRPEEPVRN